MRKAVRYIFGILATGMLVCCAGIGEGFCERAPALKSVFVYSPNGVRSNGVPVDTLLGRMMKEQGIEKPPEAGAAGFARTEAVMSEDILETVNESYYARGWTDGLPVVPPTDLRVASMLGGTKRKPSQVIAALEPMKGEATVEKIAVNAVMAGCRPEFMPVLIAAVRAASDPRFNLKGTATTTSPAVPMIIVNGPIADELGINAGSNTLGRGWRANATIGRALHLIIQNVGGSWPGVSDASCLGHPGDFSMTIAENEEESPWPPLSAERGYAEGDNILTLAAAEGLHGVIDIGVSGKEFLDLTADHLKGMSKPYRPAVLLVLVPNTAKKLAEQGWDKQKIRAYLGEKSRLPYKEYKEKFLETGIADSYGGVPSWVFGVDDQDKLIPAPFIDKLHILVAGGPGEKNMIIPLWPMSEPVSVGIED